jgi:hypothetical protein
MNTKQKLIKRLNDEKVLLDERIRKLELVTGLDTIELDATFYGTDIDLDNLKHSQVLEVMKALNAGKWTKTPGDNGTVHYTTKLGEVSVRCYQGEPPPNCKIVEYLEEVPEQIIPARMIIKRKLQCT